MDHSYDIDTTGTGAEIIAREATRARSRYMGAGQSVVDSFRAAVAPLVRVVLELLSLIGARSVAEALARLRGDHAEGGRAQAARWAAAYDELWAHRDEEYRRIAIEGMLPLVREARAVAVRSQPAHDALTTEERARRAALIDREVDGGALSQAERDELRELERRAGAWLSATTREDLAALPVTHGPGALVTAEELAIVDPGAADRRTPGPAPVPCVAVPREILVALGAAIDQASGDLHAAMATPEGTRRAFGAASPDGPEHHLDTWLARAQRELRAAQDLIPEGRTDRP